MGTILVGKIIDHEALERHGLIYDIMGDSQRVGDTTCIGDGLRTAAFILCPSHAVLGPELHRDSDDFPSLLLEQPCGNTGIHASTHSNDNAS